MVKNKKVSILQRKFQQFRPITPKTNQNIIQMLFEDFHDNIMRIKDNTYSICFEYSDISFAKADLEEAGAIFLKWVDYLNSFSESTHIQINKVWIPSKRRKRLVWRIPVTGRPHRQDLPFFLSRRL